MNDRNIAASVRARLLNQARDAKQDFNLVLTRYALERLLYRLSASPHGGQFLLKGALLFDLWILARHTPFDGDTLRRAIQATFDRRKTALPTDAPFGLTDDFAHDAHKQTQWQAFLKKNKLEALGLESVVATLRDFLMPVIIAAGSDTHYSQHWQAGGPWSPVSSG